MILSIHAQISICFVPTSRYRDNFTFTNPVFLLLLYMASLLQYVANDTL